MSYYKFAKNNLTRIAILVLATLVFSACQIADRGRLITQTFPANGEQNSVWGWVGVSFSHPMERLSVEQAFQIAPDINGVTTWDENTLWFRPIEPFNPNNKYQVHLSGDLTTSEGKVVQVDHRWDFTIREPELIYFVPTNDWGEIWRAGSDGSNPQQLTKTNGNVFEFSPDRRGNQIVFTVQNSEQGHDLWLMDREGENQHILVDCQKDICGEPAWSMDEAWIAYTRETSMQEAGGYQPAQVWTVNTRTGETSQLYQSDTAFSHSPSFSPNGEFLASYDITQGVIRILDLTTSQEEFIPRVLTGSGDWSPDGRQIVFTDVVPAENEPFVVVYVVDLATQNVITAFDEPATDTDFSQPRWSPNGDWIAVSLRPVNSGVSKALWVLRLDGSESIPIAAEPSSTFSAYRWDPWGESLVYQRLPLGSSDPHITIWRWDWETKTADLIIENGARPEWLP